MKSGELERFAGRGRSKALPPLSGRWRSAFVIFWSIYLMLPIAGIVGAAWQRAEYNSIDENWFALGIDTTAMRVSTIGSDEAKQSGLRVGDRIVAVEGVLVPKNLDDARIIASSNLAKPEGAHVALLVQSFGHAPRVVRLTHQRAHMLPLFTGSGLSPDTYKLAGILLTALCSAILVAVALVLFSRRRDPVAASLSLAVLSMAIGRDADFWAQHGLAQLPEIVSVPGAFLFILVLVTFPTGKFEPRWTFPFFLFWIVYITLYLAFDVHFSAGTNATVFAVMLAGCLTAMITRYRLQTPGPERQQWRWALFGFGASCVIIVLQKTLLVWTFGEWTKPSLTVSLWEEIVNQSLLALGYTLFYGGVVLSVLRYRLYGAQAAFNRSIIYGSLTLGLLAVFAGTEKLIELLGQEYYGEKIGILAGALGAAFAVIMFAPLHHRIAMFVESRFQGVLIALRDELPRRLADLAETEAPDTIAATLASRLQGDLRAKGVAVVWAGKPLATLGAHLAADMPQWRVPLADDGASWLGLGPRPDDTLYDRQEQTMLTALALSAGRALRIAQRRTEQDMALTTRMASTEAKIARIEALIDRMPQVCP